MTEMILEFFKNQKNTFGFEKYKLRHQKENGKKEYFIDVFTSTGLCIKTVLTYASVEEVEKFIITKTKQLPHKLTKEEIRHLLYKNGWLIKDVEKNLHEYMEYCNGYVFEKEIDDDFTDFIMK